MQIWNAALVFHEDGDDTVEFPEWKPLENTDDKWLKLPLINHETDYDDEANE